MANTATTRSYDLVVIGAGFFGLATARNFHQLFPSASLLVIEALDGLGGTWAKQRLHPDLKSNNLWGTYEYPDYPMPTASGKIVEGTCGALPDGGRYGSRDRRYDVEEEQHIPGYVMQQYLEDYVRDGGIKGMIEFGKKVVEARHLEGEEGGWALTVVDADWWDEDGGEEGMVECVAARKLVVATGLTSQPFTPAFEGEAEFGRRIFHAKAFWRLNRNGREFSSAEWEERIGLDDKAKGGSTAVEYPNKKVAVFGGTKTGWDLVYSYASRGFEVEWIIRESGYGPTWMSPIRVTPFKIRLEHIVQSRIITWFSPCIWGHVDGYSFPRWLLQGNPIGRALLRGFWWVLGDDALALSRLREHPETRKLLPWSKPMFINTGYSILNYDTDILEYVRNGQVKVHISDIQRLGKEGKIHLSNKDEPLEVDAMVCATGWKHSPPLRFLPEGIERQIGIPHPYGNTPQEHALIKRAEKVVLRKFPILRDPPVQNSKYKPLPGTEGLVAYTATLPDGKERTTVETTLTPYRLFRFMIPPSPEFLKTKDLAFVGMLMNFSVATMSHLQGIWVSRFLMGTHPLFPSQTSDGESSSESEDSDSEGEARGRQIEGQIMWETILHCTHCRYRCPIPNGQRHPDFVFDALPYVDLLCKDLGLNIHRKGWGREWFKVHLCQDYADALDESVD